jgi:hypothetical protein
MNKGTPIRGQDLSREPENPSSKLSCVCVCVCACVHAHVRVHVHACVRAVSPWQGPHLRPRPRPRLRARCVALAGTVHVCLSAQGPSRAIAPGAASRPMYVCLLRAQAALSPREQQADQLRLRLRLRPRLRAPCVALAGTVHVCPSAQGPSRAAIAPGHHTAQHIVAQHSTVQQYVCMCVCVYVCVCVCVSVGVCCLAGTGTVWLPVCLDCLVCLVCLVCPVCLV